MSDVAAYHVFLCALFTGAGKYADFVGVYYIYVDIFVNCNWVVTRWQQYSKHLHTNSTQNDTKQTIHRTTQLIWESAGRAPSWLVIPWHLPYN